MTRGELTRDVSNMTNLPIATIEEVLTAILKVIVLSLTVGDDVRLRGFGRFVPRVKSAGIKVNPMTGERKKIPARKTTVFYPSDNVKEQLNGNRARPRSK